MIRKCTDEDISDEELKKVINPFMIIIMSILLFMLCLKLLHFILLVLIVGMLCRKPHFISVIIWLKIYLMLVMMKIMIVLKLK